MNGNGNNLDGMADTTRLVFEQPRTVRDLAELTEATRETVGRHLAALISNGMVAEIGRRRGSNGRQSGPSAAVYGWVLERVAA